MIGLERRVLELVPEDGSRRRLDVILASCAPYETEAYRAVKRLEMFGHVQLSWNTHGNTFVARVR